jgi:hypothetical protein
MRPAQRPTTAAAGLIAPSSVLGGIVERESAGAQPPSATSARIAAAREDGFPRAFHRGDGDGLQGGAEAPRAAPAAGESLFKQRLRAAQESRLRAADAPPPPPSSASEAPPDPVVVVPGFDEAREAAAAGAAVAGMSPLDRQAALEEVQALLSPDLIARWLRAGGAGGATAAAPARAPAPSPVPPRRPNGPLDLSGITDEESLRRAVNELLPASEKAKLRWTGYVDEGEEEGRGSSSGQQHARARQHDSDEDADAASDDERELILPDPTASSLAASPPSGDADGGESGAPTYGPGTSQLFAWWAKAAQEGAAAAAAAAKSRGQDPDGMGALQDADEEDAAAEEEAEDGEGGDAANPLPALLSPGTVGSHLAALRKALGQDRRGRGGRPAGASSGAPSSSADDVRLTVHPSLMRLRFDLRGLLVDRAGAGAGVDASYPSPPSLASSAAAAAADSASLYHHGGDPSRAGYTFLDLLGLTRSSVEGQRAMAWRALAGVLVRRRSAFLTPSGTCPSCAHGSAAGGACASAHNPWNVPAGAWADEAARLRTLVLPPVLPILLRSGADEARGATLAPALAALIAWAAPAEGTVPPPPPADPAFVWCAHELPAPALRPQPPAEDEDDYAHLLSRSPFRARSGGGVDGVEHDVDTVEEEEGEGRPRTERTAMAALRDGREALRDPIGLLCGRMGLLERVAALLEGVAARLPPAAASGRHPSALPALSAVLLRDPHTLAAVESCLVLLQAAAARDLSLATRIARTLSITVRGGRGASGGGRGATVRVSLLRWLLHTLTAPLATADHTPFADLAGGAAGASSAAEEDAALARLAARAVRLLRTVCQQGRDLAADVCRDDVAPAAEAADGEDDAGDAGSVLSSAAVSDAAPPIRVGALLRFLPLTARAHDQLARPPAATAAGGRWAVRRRLQWEAYLLVRVCVGYDLGTGFVADLVPRLPSMMISGSSVGGVGGAAGDGLTATFAVASAELVAATVASAVRELTTLPHAPTTSQVDDAVALAEQAQSLAERVLAAQAGGEEDGRGGAPAALRAARLRVCEAYLAAAKTPRSLAFTSAVPPQASAGSADPPLLALPGLASIQGSAASAAAAASFACALLAREAGALLEALESASSASSSSSSTLVLLLAWCSLAGVVHDVSPSTSEHALWRLPPPTGPATTLRDRLIPLLASAAHRTAAAVLSGEDGEDGLSLPLLPPADVLDAARPRPASRVLASRASFACLALLHRVSPSPAPIEPSTLFLVLATLGPGDEALAWSLLADLLPLGTTSSSVSPSSSDDLVGTVRRSLLPLWRDAVLGAGDLVRAPHRIASSLARLRADAPGLFRDPAALLASAAAHSVSGASGAVPTPEGALPSLPSLDTVPSFALRPPLRQTLPPGFGRGGVGVAGGSAASSSYLAAALASLPSPLRTPLGLPLHPEALVSVPLALGLLLSGEVDVLLSESSVDALRRVRGEAGEARGEGAAEGGRASLSLTAAALSVLEALPELLPAETRVRARIPTAPAAGTAAAVAAAATLLAASVAETVGAARGLGLLLHAAVSAHLTDAASARCTRLLVRCAEEFARAAAVGGGSGGGLLRLRVADVLAGYPGVGTEAVTTLATVLLSRAGEDIPGPRTAAAEAGLWILAAVGGEGDGAAEGGGTPRRGAATATPPSVAVRRALWTAAAADPSVAARTRGLHPSSTLPVAVETDVACLSCMTSVAAKAREGEGEGEGAAATGVCSSEELAARLALLSAAGDLITPSDAEAVRALHATAAGGGASQLLLPGSSSSPSLGSFACASLAQYLWGKGGAARAGAPARLSFERCEAARQLLLAGGGGVGWGGGGGVAVLLARSC